MKDFGLRHGNDILAFHSQQPGIDEKRRVYSIYTINVKGI